VTMSATVGLDQDRVAGLMWGAAAGDALGWPQELRSSIVGGQKTKDDFHPQPHYRAWERSAGSRFSGRYRDPVGPGQYSDDTQLLCAVGRALLSGDDWYGRFTSVELPAWKIYQRGGGAAVLRAATSWAEGRAPWVTGNSARQRDAVERYRKAGANGVAMRIAPHVIWATDQGVLTSAIVQDGLTTHGHPRALLGALLYAGALRSALQSRETMQYGGLIEASRQALMDDEVAVNMLPAEWGDGAAVDRFRAEWRSAVKECSDALVAVERSLARGAMSDPEEVLRDLGCVDSPVSGAGTVTALGAVYIASRAAARPMSGLLMAAFLRKADTDTLASMTGALLGALHGPQWLGSLTAVQDAEYLLAMGSDLSAKKVWPLRDPEAPIRATADALQDALLAEPTGSTGPFLDGRQYRVLDRVSLEDGKRQRVVLALEDGQTVFVDLKPSDETTRPSPDGRATPSSDRSAPQRKVDDSAPPARESNPTTIAVQVSLLTANLNKTGAFYARLLGREVDVLPHRQVRVAEGLIFRQADGMDLQGTEQSLITLSVANLHESARALNVEIGIGPNGEEVRGRDPDGRWVQIVQSK
jgi:ADP-ribosylglycohydrolase